MADPLPKQIEQLEATIAGLEAQRLVLGDAMVDTAVAALRQQLALLQAQPNPVPAPGEERRLITILFADIVGSTALAEKLDPEEWRQTVDKFLSSAADLIVAHEGQVDSYLGDGLLAYFGVQHPSERDAENGVRAALDLQGAMANLGTRQQLQVRIGLHTGLVILGELGSASHKEFTAIGDAMNLASRLQSAAPPGGILISHDTFRHVRGVFDVTPRPPLLVKGKSTPIQTYLVRRAKPRAFRTATRGVMGVQTRTVGREQEFTRLQEGYAQAYENGCVVWAQLIGEAGIGKSRLLQDFRDWTEMREEEVRVFQARAFARDQSQPYALVRRMFFDRFQIAEDAPLARAEADWVEGFQRLARTREVEPAHALGLLVGLPFSDSPFIGAMRNDPKQVKGRAFVVGRELLRRAREEMPVELLLEDLQWADVSSWEYLEEVVLANVERAVAAGLNGMFVLGTTRPDWSPPEVLRSHPYYVQVDLAPLSDEATGELAHELLSKVDGVTPDVIELIVRQAEGVPYFAEELVNWFIDRGIVDATRTPWQFAPERLHAAPLPMTLQHLLLTRLWSLGVVERRALQCGSIFGRNFWSGGIKALGLPAGDEIIRPLQPRGLIERQPESAFTGETEWSFHHNLLRDVTYESVLKRERPQLNRAAAEWLVEQAQRAGRLDEFAGLIGEHYAQAGETGTAAVWYLQAGERAQAASALAEARHFFDSALELLPPDDREGRWRALLGREAVLDLKGERQAQKEDLDALLELAGTFDDTPGSGQALTRRALVHLRRAMFVRAMGDSHAVAPAAEAAIEAGRLAQDLAVEARALGVKTAALTRLGEMAEAAQTAEEALTRARAAGDETALAFVLGRVALYYSESGDPVRGIHCFSESAEIAHRVGDRAQEAQAVANLGVEYDVLGLHKLARPTLERALALREFLGDRRGRAYDLLNLGDLYRRMGDPRGARRLEEQALAEAAAIGDGLLRAVCLLDLGSVDEQVGDCPGAARYWTEARTECDRIGMSARAMEAASGLARCALAEGRLEEAYRLAVEVWEYLCEHGTEGMDVPTRVYVAVADIVDAVETSGRSERASVEPQLSRRTVVEAGYRELMARAQRISDPEWRQAFLENFQEHRTLIEMSQRLYRP
ncbi:MAG: adenylate/guanylate cyclase domain-containing protein [Anaerolineae bacterium]